ncbi:MAG: dihydrodipicolinate reductase [Mycolicibacterium sp.]|nr:dihydrodipicolinate reductase [Mycolicibacterium sp.]
MLATDDVEAIVAAQPDCFCYCGTAVRRDDAAIEDMARLLRAGINVVTISTIPMVYSPAAPQNWRDIVEAACREGHSSFYATGSEPGVASLNIPTALLAGAGRVHSYRMDEYALGLDETYPIWEVLHESMGFGKPDGHVPARIASGKVRHDWETVVRYIADILGYHLDAIDLDWETVTAPTDLDTNIGILPAGTICAHRWQLAGKVDGKAVTSVQYFATVSSTPWPDAWPRPVAEAASAVVYRVAGRPNMRMQLCFDAQDDEKNLNSAIALTGMAAVNAIPYVVDAEPGILDPIVDRGVVTRQAVGARARTGTRT